MSFRSAYGNGKKAKIALPDKDEKMAVIQDGINSLPDRCQEIFRLSRESGMTYREIAEILDLSIKTVETQMGRAFKKLRAFTKKFWDQAILLVVATFFGL